MREEFEMDVPPEDSFILSRVSLIAQARPFVDAVYLHSMPPLSHDTCRSARPYLLIHGTQSICPRQQQSIASAVLTIHACIAQLECVVWWLKRPYLEAVEFEDDSVASTEVDDLDGLEPEQQHDGPDVRCERPSAVSRSDTVYLDAGEPLCPHAKQHSCASVQLQTMSINLSQNPLGNFS